MNKQAKDTQNFKATGSLENLKKKKNSLSKNLKIRPLKKSKKMLIKRITRRKERRRPRKTLKEKLCSWVISTQPWDSVT